jgi:hypothetical protein
MRATISLAIAATLLTTACGSDSGTGPGAGDGRLSLSFAASAQGAASLARAGAPSLAESGSALVITKAELVLRDIKLRSPAPCGAATPSPRQGADDVGGDDNSSGGHGADDSSECELELRAGPVLIEVGPAGMVTPIRVDVPNGTYDRLRLKIHKPDDDTQSDLAFLAAHPDLRRVAIRVTGTYDGAPFVFTTDENEQLEFGFSPPLQVVDGGANVTVSLDVPAWFRAGGVTVDPRTALKGGANERIVRDNIRAAFRAFEDDDRDGRHD